MKSLSERKRRLVVLGRVSVETKGPPGAFMEAGGLWDRHRLSD